MKTVSLTMTQWSLVLNMVGFRGPEVEDEYMRFEYSRITKEIQDQVWK